MFQKNGCAELLERAEKLSVEVSVLSLCEGRSRTVYLCFGRKNELVLSCEGVYSEVMSKRFDSDVDGFLMVFFYSALVTNFQ